MSISIFYFGKFYSLINFRIKFFQPYSNKFFLWLAISVGKVIAATTPIIPRVIKTSAKVKAHFLEGTNFVTSLLGVLPRSNPAFGLFNNPDFMRLKVKSSMTKIGFKTSEMVCWRLSKPPPPCLEINHSVLFHCISSFCYFCALFFNPPTATRFPSLVKGGFLPFSLAGGGDVFHTSKNPPLGEGTSFRIRFMFLL